MINRLGFNNARPCARRSTRLRFRVATERRGRRQHRRQQGQRATASPTTCRASRRSTDVASYFTVNISSPNTPGLRDLQAPARSTSCCGRLMAGARPRRRRGQAHAGRSWSSFRPTSPRRTCATIVACARGARGRRHRGVEHDAVAAAGSPIRAAREAGGLSGRPLFHRSTVMLARVYRASGGKHPADRHRRHRQRRDGAGQDRGGRHADPALHRADLRGTGIDPRASRSI